MKGGRRRGTWEKGFVVSFVYDEGIRYRNDHRHSLYLKADGERSASDTTYCQISEGFLLHQSSAPAGIGGEGTMQERDLEFSFS